MGVFGFVLSGGGTAGVLLGGVLTDALSWHWIFLVNLPIGVLVCALSLRLLPAAGRTRGRIDLAGAVTITVSLMLAVYAIVNGNETGWTASQTLGLLAAAAALLGAFLVIERRAAAPLVRLGLFRKRNVATANVVGVLQAAAMFAAFFLSALYLQLVLGYSPLAVGLAYLPATLIWGATSLVLSDRLVMRLGVKPPLVSGLVLFAISLLLLARVPVEGDYLVDVLPAMLLQGLGGGIVFNPLLLSAMSDVDPRESGLASGVVNTSFTMGGALGLAVLASLAASRTDGLLDGGDAQAAALTGGYHAAFLAAGLFAAVGAVLSAWLIRAGRPPAVHGAEEPMPVPAAAAAD